MKALVIIPTYNELANIRGITADVLGVSDMTEVLIVDDNSPDGTGAAADELAAADPRVRVMHRAGKLGLGSAYIQGFKYALAEGYDYVFEMDADYSHDPREIPNFLEAVKEGDVVVGSRYVGGIRILNWPLKRLMLSYSASVYTRLITGLKIFDCTSGFKCFRREALQAIDLDRVHSDGYSFQIEMNFLCQRKGLRLVEVPIVFTDRKQGHSKMNRGIVIEALFVVWLLKIKSVLGML
ncbi:MAG TPA: polyprenol monophosphomannose synthase [Nitrospirota bacterium]|nr:polyprenol monophosphomannose synthase [Nitrospirota bacterium]